MPGQVCSCCLWQAFCQGTSSIRLTIEANEKNFKVRVCVYVCRNEDV